MVRVLPVILSVLLPICSNTSASHVRGARTRRTKDCKYEENKYYEPQIVRCLKCDKCIVGKGQVPRTEFDLTFDLKHGALNCLPCRTCPEMTFNNKRSYNCQPCKNCTQLGRVELRPCSAKSDAVCGDYIPKHVTKPNAVTYSPTYEIPLGNGNLKSLEIEGAGLSIAMIAVVSIIVVTALFGTSIIYYNRKSKTGRKGYEKEPSLTNYEWNKEAEKDPITSLNNTSKNEPSAVSSKYCEESEETEPKTTGTKLLTSIDGDSVVRTTISKHEHSKPVQKYMSLDSVTFCSPATCKIGYYMCMQDISESSSSYNYHSLNSSSHLDSLNAMSDFQYQLRSFEKETYV